MLRTLTLLCLAACDPEAGDKGGFAPPPRDTAADTAGDTDTAPADSADTAPDDADGDGSPAADDCDDADASRHPGARDACGDGVDRDCDGADACPRRLTGVVALADADGIFDLADAEWLGGGVHGGDDLDGDGVPDVLVGSDTLVVVQSGLRALGAIGTADVALIGATEPDVGDLDGDGALDAVVLETTWRIGVYCGPLDLTTGAAPARCRERPTGVQSPTFAVAGDTDGDGFDDLLIGGWDAGAYLERGPLADSADAITETAQTRIVHGSGATWAAAAGDTDGDGLDDVAVGFSDRGETGLFLGPVPEGELTLDDAWAVFPGAMPAGAGDLDGDGLAELAVVDTLAGATVVRLFSGPVAAGPQDEDAADATLFATGGDDAYARHVATAGDLDGDGRDDLLVGTAGDTFDHDVVYLFYGDGLAGPRALSSADAVFVPEEQYGSELAYAASGAGDLDGDGMGDLLLGARGTDRAYVVLAATAAVPEDADRDGYAVDCDDEDPDVSPGDAEDCGDGVDQDCDGVVDSPCRDVRPTGGLATWVGEPGDRAGTALAAPGDLDGDGRPELLVAGHRAENEPVLWWMPEDAASIADAQGLLVAGDTYRRTFALAAGELDGDAGRELAIGGAPTDVVSVFLAPEGGAWDETRAPVVVETDTPVGSYPYALGDLDGDAVEDLLVGALCEDWSGGECSASYLFRGPLGPADLGPQDAATTLRSGEGLDWLGAAATAGDADGDGVTDVLLAAPRAGDYWGVVLYLVEGPLPAGDVFLPTDALASWTSSTDGAGAAVAWAGDTDGDGHGEAAVGSTAGRAWLLGPPWSVRADLDASAVRRFAGDVEGDGTGTALAAPGDLDGDALAEVLVGAPAHPGAAFEGGRVMLYRGGAPAGTYAPADADAAWLGETAGAAFGTAVLAPGDLDGDGVPELIFGAPGDMAGGIHAGAVVRATWPQFRRLPTSLACPSTRPSLRSGP